MSDPIELLNRALTIDMVRMKSISHNSANLHVPGYKAQQVIVQPFNAADSVQAEAISAQSGQRSITTHTLERDLSIGGFKKSSNPHAIAINHAGFIQVETDQGVRYSRGGSLKIDHQGVLTLGDHPVMGQRGAITLDPTEFSILSSGEIQQQGKTVDKLSLFEFEHPETLDYQGKGLFAATSEQPSLVTATNPFLPGFIELSNVSSTETSIKMIEISRQFEMNQQILKSYDSLLNSAINDLGDL